jgi:hypothetical protein
VQVQYNQITECETKVSKKKNPKTHGIIIKIPTTDQRLNNALPTQTAVKSINEKHPETLHFKNT